MNQLTTEVNIPVGFKTILEWFSRAVILIQPNDIQQFAAFYFKELLRLREEKPNLDIFGLLKEFQYDRVGLLTSLCTENDDAPLTQTAADYNEYLNEDGIRSILVGADQTDTVVVFRKTAKNKCSPPTDVPDSTSHRDSALFERVPLSQIDFTPNTVLIKTQSIPCKYMILVQSEKVPECIVFQRDDPESPPQAEETVGKDESHDEKMESALAISLIAEVSESSEESVEVKSELAELIEKFKGFMNRLVSPQQKSKDSLETYLSTSEPIETTTSSLVPPQISSLEESPEQATTKSGPTSEPVEVATDLTCRPVSRSHGSVSPVAATKINPIQAKIAYPSMPTHANEKPTMTYSTYTSPETMPRANVLPNETRVSMDPVRTATACTTNPPVSTPNVSVYSSHAFTETMPCDCFQSQMHEGKPSFQVQCNHHAASCTYRLSRQSHLSICPHQAIRPATCDCNWRICHIVPPDTAMTCSEHMLIPDHPRIPMYQDLSARSSVHGIQPEVVCNCPYMRPMSSSSMRVQTAPALMSSGHRYAKLPRYIYFKSIPHDIHNMQAMDSQCCMFPATPSNEGHHQHITAGINAQQPCCKRHCEERYDS